MTLSIVIPAKNEGGAIGTVVSKAREQYADAEIIVVDDGSDDDTAAVAAAAGATVISHPESLGNGAAVKSGARAATGDVIAFMDGDGQHDAAELAPLLESFVREWSLQRHRVNDEWSQDSGSDIRVSCRTSREVQTVLIPAAQRIFLSNNHHDGIPA